MDITRIGNNVAQHVSSNTFPKPPRKKQEPVRRASSLTVKPQKIYLSIPGIVESKVDLSQGDVEDTQRMLSKSQQSSGNTIDPNSLELDSKVLLGEGNQGVVVLGKYDGNKVAVKVLNYDTMDKTLVNNEISALKELAYHPNILRFYGTCLKDKNQFCIVTKYATNGDLYRIINNKKDKFSITQKLCLLQQIASGMKFAHENNFIHRDLKAANILVRNENCSLIEIVGRKSCRSDCRFWNGRNQ